MSDCASSLAESARKRVKRNLECVKDNRKEGRIQSLIESLTCKLASEQPSLPSSVLIVGPSRRRR